MGYAVQDLIKLSREQDLNVSPVGVDIFLRRWQKAKKYQGIFVQGDAINLPFQDNEFDMVYAVESIFTYYNLHEPDHIDAWKSALLEARRVTKNNGTILFNTATFQQPGLVKTLVFIQSLPGLEVLYPSSEVMNSFHDGEQQYRGAYVLRVVK